MVGGVSEAHVQKDVDDAKNLGLDGFALNYGKYFSNIHEGRI